MTTSSSKARKALEILNKYNTENFIERVEKRIEGDPENSIIRTESIPSFKGKEHRLSLLDKITGVKLPILSSDSPVNDLSILQGNIENYIGMSRVPTGLIGPLKILGSSAIGEFYIPLATSEGALIASYNRGAKAGTLAGGITSVCLNEGVQRSPVFKFKNIAQLGSFLIWILGNEENFKEIVSKTSRYAVLSEMKVNIEGNCLILIFEYRTGDAAGQNMVTICTEEICRFIEAKSPVKPEYWFIESNYSGDKKATALSFTNVRGKKVVSEAIIPNKIVQNILRTTPKKIVEYWQSSTIGIIQSGAIGAQGHFANGLTALFIATGQDVACVTEAAVGITRMEIVEKTNLYISVTLPNLIVGTVGGGTGLPTQRECLELLGCLGEGKSRKFAEICGAVVLAGELSIAAAIASGQFSDAHKKLGRKR